jgi:diguanylate cyclase (GGDEF)-like protein
MPLFDRRKPVPEKATPPAAAEPPRAPLDPSHDSLTGLLGTESLNHELAAAIEASGGGEHVAVAHVAFDGLRELIDRSGNLVGDTLLRELGKRLKATVREADHVGRISRDEFLIVFRQLHGRLETLALVSRLRIALGEPIKLATGPYKPLANIGLAHPPADGTSSDALTGVAEKAMLAMREQMRDAAKRDAVERLANARTAVDTAAKNLTAAEQAVRDADIALADSKKLLAEAKAAVVAATDHAKSLGVADTAAPAPK